MTTTFDPILEVHRVPRGGALPRPTAGTALVVGTPGQPLQVVGPGDPVPSRTRHRRTAHLVDLSTYELRITGGFPSAERSFEHRCALTFSCRVHDPAQIVALGIRDMTEAVQLSLTRTVRAVARRYTLAQADLAETAILEELEPCCGDEVVEVGNFLVEFHVPGAGSAGSSEAYFDVVRKNELERVRRRAMQDLVEEGRNALVAQSLAKNDGDPTAFFQQEHAARVLDKEYALRGLAALNGASGDEAFESRHERRTLFGTLIGESGTAEGPRSRRGARRPRLSETAAPKDTAAEPDPAPPAGPAVTTPADTAPADAAPAEPRVRASRVRGMSAHRGRPAAPRRPERRDPDAR